jgi:hypothetical protein
MSDRSAQAVKMKKRSTKKLKPQLSRDEQLELAFELELEARIIRLQICDEPELDWSRQKPGQPLPPLFWN